MNIMQSVHQTIAFLNENQGVLTAAIFLLTILLGWFSGIFKALRRKPELKIETLAGPTFVCVFGTGRRHENYDLHRTGIALYLRISNAGVVSTDITEIKVGYHWNISICSLLNCIRYRLGWFYLGEQTVCLADFQTPIGENVKIYPFLTQKSFISGDTPETYLEPGRSINGVVYFEQTESWGGCFPVSRNLKTKMKIVISDAFGRRYQHITKIDRVSLKDARKYNPKFGTTLSELHGSSEPIELPMDKHGNLLPPNFE